MKIFMHVLDHRGREAWRHYRCVVELCGPGSLEARELRRSLTALLQDYTPTRVRLDGRQAVVGLA